MSRLIKLSLEQWNTFLNSLYERGDKLGLREEGAEYSKSERVDAYVFSAHAEALWSEDVDGDIWGTLEDIEEKASDEAEAWAKICDFYLNRECVLIHISSEEEWLISTALAQRLGLM